MTRTRQSRKLRNTLEEIGEMTASRPKATFDDRIMSRARRVDEHEQPKPDRAD